MDRFFEDDGDGDIAASATSSASAVPAVLANPNRPAAGSTVASSKPVPMLGELPFYTKMYSLGSNQFSGRAKKPFVRQLRSAVGPEISVSFEETRVRYDAETSRVTLRREALIKGPDTAKAKLEAASTAWPRRAARASWSR